jgi:hypothetical protein
MSVAHRAEASELSPVLDKLASILEAAGVPVRTWGTGDAKTLQHLATELTRQECLLCLNVQGLVTRHVSVVAIDVYFTPTTGLRRRLIERRQVFHDGRVRRRRLEASLGEKIVGSETPDAASLRAIQEELEIPPHQVTLQFVRSVIHTELSSRSYPGLPVARTLHFYTADLTPAAFNPGGYIEEQTDKRVEFEWQRVAEREQAKDECRLADAGKSPPVRT